MSPVERVSLYLVIMSIMEKECRHSAVYRIVQCFVKGSVVSFVKQQYANPVKQTKRLFNAIPSPYSQSCINAKCPEARHSCCMFLQYAAFLVGGGCVACTLVVVGIPGRVRCTVLGYRSILASVERRDRLGLRASVVRV